MQGQNDKYYEFLYEPSLTHMGRAIWGNRQLYEVMVEFWSDHLHIPAPADKGSWARHRYDGDVIRKHALGRFQDMLVASAFHPAMLAYLDAEQSTRQQPNENYARELMELHTLGVNGGYTERDVKQAALLFTGWETPWDTGKTRFVSSRHYSKPVTILGRKIANGNGATGRTSQKHFVAYLATHPSTARHVCRKLAIRFVSDDPSKELVDALAQTYLRNGTAIVPVLRHLFGTVEFAESAGAKLRRPFERFAATLRTLNVPFDISHDGMMRIYWTMSQLGHNPYNWPTPDGFPDVASSWQSPATALQLINDTSGLVHAWWDQSLKLPGPKKLLPKAPANRAAAIDAVSRRLLGRLPTSAEKVAAATLLASTDLPKTFNRPGYQREETIALIALLLFNSPAFLTR
jgi:uncharacterized protein (DUF1800 family)